MHKDHLDRFMQQHRSSVGQRWLGRFAGVSVIESGKQLYAGVAERSQSPALVAARPKLRIASSRDTHAARNAGDGESVYVCVGGADGYVGRDGVPGSFGSASSSA